MNRKNKQMITSCERKPTKIISAMNIKLKEKVDMSPRRSLYWLQKHKSSYLQHDPGKVGKNPNPKKKGEKSNRTEKWKTVTKKR